MLIGDDKERKKELRILFSLLFIFVLILLLKQVNNRRLYLAFLIGYVIVVMFITLGGRSFDAENRIALNPLHEYLTVVKIAKMGLQRGGYRGALNRLWAYRHVINSFLLNILLFVPLGYLVPGIVPNVDRVWKIALIGFGFSLFIEVTQLITHLGWFDTSDLLHNTLGALIGYGIYKKILVIS